MKIVKQTADQLIAGQNGQTFLLIFGLFWLAPCLFAVFSILYGAGVMELTCQRSSSQTITCEKKQSRFFGFTQDQPITIQQLTGSRLLQETREDDDGDDYNVYQAILLDLNSPVPITEFSTEYRQKKRIVDQVSLFISSTQSDLTLHRDQRWTLQGIFPLIFMIPFVFVGVGMIAGGLYSRFFVFDRVMNRLYLKSSITPLWQWQEEYPLYEINAIDLNEDKDSDGDAVYEAEVVLISGKRLSLYRTSNRSEAEKISQPVQQFLSHTLPAHAEFHRQTKSLPSDHSSPESQTEAISKASNSSVILVGKYGTYSTQNRLIETMPAPQHCHHRELLSLGFESLGDLQVEKMSLMLWGYAHAEADMYAVLYDMGSDEDRVELPPILDFYTMFSNGASLTTSTMKSWINDLPEYKIFRNAYPNASIPELYNQHFKRVIELIPQLGSPRPTGNLRYLAASLDDYRRREPSGFGIKILLYARPIWSWLMTGKVM